MLPDQPQVSPQVEITRLNIVLQCQGQTINTLTLNLANALSELETLKKGNPDSVSNPPTK